MGRSRETPGHWRVRGERIELRAYVGPDPISGRKRYATKTIPACPPKEAERHLALFVIQSGRSPISAEDTFGGLVERWIATAAPSWSPAGVVTARRTLDYYLGPLLAVRLDKVRTADLDAFYGSLRTNGGRCRLPKDERCTARPCEHGRPLSSSTVNRVHDVVRSALEQAVKWGLLAANPAVLASPGPADDTEIRPPTTADVVRMLRAAEAKSSEFATALVVGATTSRRRGEVCALCWENLDLDRGDMAVEFVISVGADGPVRVRKRARSRKGKPTRVALDPWTVDILRAHRARMVQRALAAGVSLPATGFVFSHAADGSIPWRPDYLSLKFRRLRDELGLDGVRLHDLRHYVVTTLLGAGVDQRTVMGRSGHSSLASLGRYGHFLEAQDRAAAELLGRLLAQPQPTTGDVVALAP